MAQLQPIRESYEETSKDLIHETEAEVQRQQELARSQSDKEKDKQGIVEKVKSKVKKLKDKVKKQQQKLKHGSSAANNTTILESEDEIEYESEESPFKNSDHEPSPPPLPAHETHEVQEVQRVLTGLDTFGTRHVFAPENPIDGDIRHRNQQEEPSKGSQRTDVVLQIHDDDGHFEKIVHASSITAAQGIEPASAVAHCVDPGRTQHQSNPVPSMVHPFKDSQTDESVECHVNASPSSSLATYKLVARGDEPYSSSTVSDTSTMRVRDQNSHFFEDTDNGYSHQAAVSSNLMLNPEKPVNGVDFEGHDDETVTGIDSPAGNRDEDGHLKVSDEANETEPIFFGSQKKYGGTGELANQRRQQEDDFGYSRLEITPERDIKGDLGDVIQTGRENQKELKEDLGDDVTQTNLRKLKTPSDLEDVQIPGLGSPAELRDFDVVSYPSSELSGTTLDEPAPASKSALKVATESNDGSGHDASKVHVTPSISESTPATHDRVELNSHTDTDTVPFRRYVFSPLGTETRPDLEEYAGKSKDDLACFNQDVKAMIQDDESTLKYMETQRNLHSPLEYRDSNIIGKSAEHDIGIGPAGIGFAKSEISEGKPELNPGSAKQREDATANVDFAADGMISEEKFRNKENIDYSAESQEYSEHTAGSPVHVHGSAVPPVVSDSLDEDLQWEDAKNVLEAPGNTVQQEKDFAVPKINLQALDLANKSSEDFSKSARNEIDDPSRSSSRKASSAPDIKLQEEKESMIDDEEPGDEETKAPGLLEKAKAKVSEIVEKLVEPFQSQSQEDDHVDQDSDPAAAAYIKVSKMVELRDPVSEKVKDSQEDDIIMVTDPGKNLMQEDEAKSAGAGVNDIHEGTEPESYTHKLYAAGDAIASKIAGTVKETLLPHAKPQNDERQQSSSHN